jgi:4a-hydroxytetrahydrobiopterin dehydratase
MEYIQVTPEEFDRLEGVGDWRFLLGAIHADFRAGTYPGATALAMAIAEAAEEAIHHPDIDVRYPDRVRVVLTTHATGGLTMLDVDLARRISELAAQSGAQVDPPIAQATEITIDTTDVDRLRPFWRAVMGGYAERGPRLLVDPLRAGPTICFQLADADRPGRNRVHVDVSVPHDVAEQRVAAAIDAGGTLVTDHHARSWWVLADPDGNEACVSTWLDRA